MRPGYGGRGPPIPGELVAGVSEVGEAVSGRPGVPGPRRGVSERERATG
jgi:hypothetical protein